MIQLTTKIFILVPLLKKTEKILSYFTCVLPFFTTGTYKTVVQYKFGSKSSGPESVHALTSRNNWKFNLFQYTDLVLACFFYKIKY